MFFGGGGGGGFPFGDMGGGMGGPRGPPKEVDNNKFYDLLGVGKKASTDEIRRAFKKSALKNHPDRGGDKEKFQEIQEAHEILTDEKKRSIYDKYGEEGLKEGGGGGGGMDDILNMFMGGGRGPQRDAGPKKMKPFKHPLKVTLEEIYSGKKTKIAVNRERICKACDGKGGKEGAVKRCTPCQGRGMVTRMQQLGPGYYTQSTGPCDECNGKGEQINEKDKCQKCNGKRVQKEKKIIDAEIDKGAPNGQQYTFYGEADEFPGAEAGDVIIIVQEQQHKVFKRKGADILMEKEITLY